MLKNIRLHIDADEQKQAEVEASLSPVIQQNQRESLNGFMRYIPSLTNRLKQGATAHISVFCNAGGELNIVDYDTGRTLYGLQPRQEINAQFHQYCQQSAKLTLTDGACKLEPLPKKIQSIAVLGLGAGYHIGWLIEHFEIEHLIIYEPEDQYLICSISMVSWQHILKLAQQKGTSLYFQVERDGRDLCSDLGELRANIELDECFLYKHYNHPVFDAIMYRAREDGLEGLQNLPSAALTNEVREDVVPRWSVPVEIENWHSDWLSMHRFEINLTAFKRFFPAIYSEFADYSPTHWQPKANAANEVNMFHQRKNVNFYSESPFADCELNLASFARYPHKDGLILGYKGKKLRKFLHYQMVKKIEPILEQLEDEQGELPSTVKSMIMFGLGAGYQLESLVADYEVEKLFICEPNKDFFYASLFAIDWCEILEKIDSHQGRLYINIGDDGTHLFEDLITQFQTVGPYVLANTYFYQSYYNEKLVAAVAQLREQLQVLIAMGDYFDHSRHVFAHTKEGIERQIPNLLKNPSQFLSANHKSVPVFVVGNGPSLDNLIDLIKEHKDDAIIVSCGTALQTLHRHGIVPDFHAEIEANRSTFDWASRVGDFDYLKNITLISCNGVHPDTTDLYKDVLIAFKQGESATVCIQELYKKAFPFAQLAFAYPTVTNFVADFLAQFAFEQIYLIGVDMGFVDTKYHHSKSSGYYQDDGNERFDYRKTSNTSMVVPGNFRPLVNTKHEFKIAKQVLERPLARLGDVYNLNDGALIRGALPLHKDDVLVLSNAKNKQECIAVIKERAFAVLDTEDFEQKFAKRFQHDQLIEELQQLSILVDQEFDTLADAERLIDQQRSMLVSSLRSNKSLLFFYLNGSLNFVNSALTKIVAIDDETVALDLFSQVLSCWRQALKNITISLRAEPYAFDSVASFSSARQRYMFPWYMEKNNVTIASNDRIIRELLPDAFSFCGLEDRTSFTSEASVYITRSLNDAKVFSNKHEKVIYLHTDTVISENETVNQDGIITLYLPDYIRDSYKPVYCNLFYACVIAISAATLPSVNGIVVPIMHIDSSCQSIEEIYDLSFTENLYAYEFTHIFLFTLEPLKENQKSIALGDRAMFIPEFKAQSLVAIHQMDMAKQQKVRDNLPNILSENKNG